jgi:hypothetical protein
MEAVGDLHDRVAGLDLALFEDAQVETRPPVPGQQRGHARFVEPNAHLEAGHPGPGDLEERRADREAVAEADLAVGRALDR